MEEMESLPQVTSEIERDLPKIIVQTLKTDSPPSSMDFHPTLHTLILGYSIQLDVTV
ncbi:topless-related protein 1-like [Senna tora]|uniref:Topless-related protein 1-like n=1 Tax=Senna tora TaxID=362788 RepID=A0A834SXH6_9FABA|nr:topless-related protein 1-like [Senna tora]